MLLMTNVLFVFLTFEGLDANRMLFVCDIFNIHLSENLNKNYVYVLRYMTINYVSINWHQFSNFAQYKLLYAI